MNKKLTNYCYFCGKKLKNINPTLFDKGKLYYVVIPSRPHRLMSYAHVKCFDQGDFAF